MSWSIYGLEKATPIAEVRLKVQALNLPAEIEAHINLALDGIMLYHPDEDNLHVIVTGYGHLCTGVGSYPVTTATLKVERASP